MATYLYCVLAPARSRALPSGLTGIAGASVRSLPFGSSGAMEAWVSTLDEATLRATGRALVTQALLHNEVVNAALRTGRTPAPARYGSNFSDDATCIADLDHRSAALEATLARIADSVEIAVLLVPTNGVTPIHAATRPSADEPAAGRRYLESVRHRTRQEQQRRASAEAEAERLGSAVGPYIRAEVRSLAPTGVMSVAHLVRNADVASYRSAVAGFVATGAYRIVVGETRAPYSFADSGLDHIGHDSGNHA